MANTLVTKNSSSAANVPTAGEMVEGELAINTADQILYSKTATTVFRVGVYDDVAESISGAWVFEAASGNTNLLVQKSAAGNQATITVNNEAGVQRWIIGAAGGTDDDFFIGRYNDAAAWQGSALYVDGITGQVDLRFASDATKLSVVTGGVNITGTMAATTVTGANVTSGADPGHTHTTASITNLSGTNTGDNAVNTLYSGLVTDSGEPATLRNGGTPTLNTGVTALEMRTLIGAGTGDGTVTAVNNGNGMNFTNITSSGTVTLGTPGSITDTSTNSVSASSHTHAVSHTGTGNFVMAASPTITGTMTVATVEMADNILRRPYIDDYALFRTTYTAVASSTLNYSTAQVYAITMNANITTLTISNPPATGRYGEMTLKLIYNSATARTIAWPAAVKWGTPGAPTLTSVSGKHDVIHLWTDDAGTTWYGSYILNY